MRQLTPVTNLLLAICFGLLTVPTLGMPWYAPAEPPSGSGDGAMEAIATDVREFFTLPGTSGADALGGAQHTIIALGVVTALLALLMLVGAGRKVVRELLRFVPLALPILIVLKAADHPAPGQELRHGILVAFGVAVFAASAAYQGADLPEPKAKPKPYVPPPPPAGSMSPPGL